MLLLAKTVNVPVAGFQSLAERAGAAELSNPEPLLPPVINTVPSGSTVALSCRRAVCIAPTHFQAGVPLFRSMISAEFVGGSPPPTVNIFLASYIATEP